MVMDGSSLVYRNGLPPQPPRDQPRLESIPQIYRPVDGGRKVEGFADHALSSSVKSSGISGGGAAARPAIQAATPTAAKNTTPIQACESGGLVVAIATAIMSAAIPHIKAINKQHR
jgi:hypothetical protein